VLLVLPFTSALALLRHVRHGLAGGQSTELLARCALLLIRIHQRALVANQTLRPLLSGLRDALHSRVAELKDCVGVNIAALRFFSAVLASEDLSRVPEDGGAQAAAASGKGGEGEGVRIGKRRRVKLF
jgi:U3 small nucleolar RNA-associated protein 12